MPRPVIHIENGRRGLPRQPVPLRFAFLVTGLELFDFLFLLAVRQEQRYEYLTSYEHAASTEPREVPRQIYERILNTSSADASELELVALLPRDHFVWSDELASAFSQFIRDCPGDEEAQARGMGLTWNPAWRGMDNLIEECVDLSDLGARTPPSALSKSQLGKQATQARHERWCQARDTLKQQHPEKSECWISERIARMAIAEGKDSETIRKNMKRK